MNREPIYAALFNLVKASTVFTTASRRLKHWSDVPPADQPALFMAQRPESVQTVPGMPSVHVLSVDLYLYANTQDVNDAPAQILNTLLDAVEASLAPDKITNKCRLGGLVEHAWIEGSIETDEGTLGDQAVCIIPIKIKVP